MPRTVTNGSASSIIHLFLKINGPCRFCVLRLCFNWFANCQTAHSLLYYSNGSPYADAAMLAPSPSHFASHCSISQLSTRNGVEADKLCTYTRKTKGSASIIWSFAPRSICYIPSVQYITLWESGSCSVLTVCGAPVGREEVCARVILLRVG